MKQFENCFAFFTRRQLHSAVTDLKFELEGLINGYTKLHLLSKAGWDGRSVDVEASAPPSSKVRRFNSAHSTLRMPRATPILMLLLAIVPLFNALDCRKFSFAPACRGIMLKRSGAHALADVTEQAQADLIQKSNQMQLLSWLLRQVEEESVPKNCVSVEWLREKLYSAALEAYVN